MGLLCGMIRRLGSVVIALGCLGIGLAACASSGNSSGQKVSIGASFLSEAYQATQSASSATMTLTEKVHSPSLTLTLKGSGAFHFSPPYGHLSFAVGGLHMQMDFNGTTAYIQVPPAAQSQLGGKAWVAVSTASLTSGTTSYDPNEFLQLLTSQAQSVTKIGPSTVGGVAATEYRVVMDLDKSEMARSSVGQQLIAQYTTLLGGHLLPTDVWIDTAGRLRQMTFELTITRPPPGQAIPANDLPIVVSATMQMTNYGVTVHITTPPASQVTTMTLQQLLQLEQSVGASSAG